MPILKAHKTWSTPKQWVEHIKKVPLGPNVVSFLGHSDLRVGVMGLSRATAGLFLRVKAFHIVTAKACRVG